MSANYFRSPFLGAALCAALLSSGCSSSDTVPGTYLMPVDAAKAKLTGAEKHYTEGGQNTRTVKATGWNGDTLKVRISTSVGENFTQNCAAKVEPVDEETTRIIPECGTGMNAGHEVTLKSLEAEVDEFVMAVLNDSEMDGKRILLRGAASAAGNMDEMRREALEADRKFRENGGSFQAPGDGWADDAGPAAPDDDWGDS